MATRNVNPQPLPLTTKPPKQVATVEWEDGDAEAKTIWIGMRSYNGRRYDARAHLRLLAASNTAVPVGQCQVKFDWQ